MTREGERVEAYRRTAIIFMVAVVLILSFMIIRPFIVAILSAGALAYIFHPFYIGTLKYLPKRIRAKELGAMFTCLVIVLLVLVPVAFVTTLLTYELKEGYLFLQNFLLVQQPLDNFPFLSQWIGYLPQFKEIATDLTGQFIGVLQGILKSIPNVILNIFITVFSIYYFLKHGKDLYNFFAGLIPLPEGRNKQILSRFDDLTRGMLLGQIVVGAVQGVLAWAGFAYLQVPNPVLWGFLTALISIIPLLGAALVWVPVAGYLALVGSMTGDYWRALALLIYGTFEISLIANLLK